MTAYWILLLITAFIAYVIGSMKSMVIASNFVIFCNSRELFHFSYQRYIENQIRAVFGLEGTPVRIVIRQKGDKE